MCELSETDQLFLEVGKCLTNWNRIEEEVLRFVAYGCSSDIYWQPMELSVGYWAVVSFEARLKWCSSVVNLRTRGAAYTDLAAKWTNLNSQLTAKSKQRAKVAHGTVVGLSNEPGGTKKMYLVPYFYSRRTEFNTLSHEELKVVKQESYFEKMTSADLVATKDRFIKLRQELDQFLNDWRHLDKETERFGPES